MRNPARRRRPSSSTHSWFSPFHCAHGRPLTLAFGVGAATGVTRPRGTRGGGLGFVVGPGVGVGGGGAPLRLTRAILLALISVNQMLPSGPAAICRGLVNWGEAWISVSAPAVVIRPILLLVPA